MVLMLWGVGHFAQCGWVWLPTFLLRTTVESFRVNPSLDRNHHVLALAAVDDRTYRWCALSRWQEDRRGLVWHHLRGQVVICIGIFLFTSDLTAIHRHQ